MRCRFQGKKNDPHGSVKNRGASEFRSTSDDPNNIESGHNEMGMNS